METLALDIGGHRTKWAIFRDGRVSDSGSYETPSEPRRILEPLSKRSPSAVAVAFAGFAHKGRIAFSPNLPKYQGFPLADLIQEETGALVVLDNDANLFTLGEARAGAGQGFRIVLGLTLGTGIGGGLVIDGRIYRGAGFALEPGHIVVDPDGPACNCGGRGCLEAMIGENAFSQRFGYGGAKEAFEAGDADAWKFYGDWLGIGIANLINILDPEAVILGGGISKAYDMFREATESAIAGQVVGWEKRNTRLICSALGDEAALWGGYFLAKDTGN
ncbi:MAG: ROK family protein [candidate division WOR-3 bacterium]